MNQFYTFRANNMTVTTRTSLNVWRTAGTRAPEVCRHSLQKYFLKGLEKLEYWYRSFESHLGNKEYPCFVCVCVLPCVGTTLGSADLPSTKCLKGFVVSEASSEMKQKTGSDA